MLREEKMHLNNLIQEIFKVCYYNTILFHNIRTKDITKLTHKFYPDAHMLILSWTPVRTKYLGIAIMGFN